MLGIPDVLTPPPGGGASWSNAAKMIATLASSLLGWRRRAGRRRRYLFPSDACLLRAEYVDRIWDLTEYRQLGNIDPSHLFPRLLPAFIRAIYFSMWTARSVPSIVYIC